MEDDKLSFYPVNLRLDGRECLVVGGGGVGERKVRSLLAAGARVSVLSPLLTPALTALVAAGCLVHIPAEYRPGAIGKFFIVICATDEAAVNREAALEARARGALVNVADSPGLGDFTVPAHVARGDLLLTVSTGGRSPALARCLREELATRYGPEYGACLAMIAGLRDELKEKMATAAERGDFWRAALSQEVLALLKEGRTREAEEKIKDAVSRFGA